MFTEKEIQILDLLVDGCAWGELEKRLEVSRSTVKRRLFRMCRRAGLPVNRFGFIALVAEEVYRRNPGLIPFANGDRAREVGAVSAPDFATLKLALDAYRRKPNESDIQKGSHHLSEARRERDSYERRAR